MVQGTIGSKSFKTQGEILAFGKDLPPHVLAALVDCIALNSTAVEVMDEKTNKKVRPPPLSPGSRWSYRGLVP